MTRLEAAHAGLNKYEGRKCKKCGTTEKYVTGAECVKCTKEHASARRNKFRDIKLAARKTLAKVV